MLIAETTRPPTAGLLRDAIREGQQRYFARCRSRIPGFVARHMSVRGAARRYYPPSAVEILRLAASVALTPLMALVQLVLWPLGLGRHALWLQARAFVRRLSQPRAHALLARAVEDEVFSGPGHGNARPVHELERCVFESPSFSAWLQEALAATYPHRSEAELADQARSLIGALRRDATGTSPESDSHLSEVLDQARAAVGTAEIEGELDSVVAGEAARSDVINTVLTGFVAKAALGQLKLGVYGIALLLAPPLYFRWSSGREERIRRAIDGLLPDGRWSLSKAGWNFDWTDSFESVALMIGLFLGLSAVFSIFGYLVAPLLAPVWRRTGLPALSLRRAVDAAEHKMREGQSQRGLSPEVFAAKIGDVAELFTRSG